ncbi:hypothetical protein ABZ540_14815 [Nocardia xishanensis]|uniref:hypothetical protein n=1 Tax=Nocardia xishanensis TaxID=238964 RepID=UPI0033F590A0
MSRGALSEVYPRLPGPARFVADVVAELELGKSVVLVFPDSLAESGIADAILDDIAAEGARAEYCEPSAEPFPTRILSTFGADPVSERAFDEWETIIGWEPWHESWVLIPGWQHHDVAEIVDRWPAQLTACGLATEDRPKLVIAVRLADLPRKAISHLDRSGIAVHWWWGVLDRLDTETRLAAVSDRRLDPIGAAVVTELSGWDLHCIDYLVDNWDRTTTGLPAVVRGYQHTASSQAWSAGADARSTVRRGTTAPPAELEQPWRDGLVDRWGQSIRWAPHTLDDAAVTQRLWMAHNRILIPHVDEERSHLVELILKKATPQALEGLFRRDDDIIEIGSLVWLVEARGVDIDRRNRQRLHTFRDLRNNLAHRKPIPDGLLRRAIDYLEF